MRNVAKVVLKMNEVLTAETWKCFVELNSYKVKNESEIRPTRRA